MVKYELIAKTGTYTNKAGEEKNRWMKCGVVMETARGLSLKLEAVPIGSDGWFILSEPKPADKPKPAQDIQEDAPF